MFNQITTELNFSLGPSRRLTLTSKNLSIMSKLDKCALHIWRQVPTFSQCRKYCICNKAEGNTPFQAGQMVSIWLLSSVGRVQLAFSPMSNYSGYSQGCLSATALIGCAGNMTIEWTGLILPLFQCEARMAFQPLARKYFFYSNTARKLALLASSLTADWS